MYLHHTNEINTWPKTYRTKITLPPNGYESVSLVSVVTEVFMEHDTILEFGSILSNVMKYKKVVSMLDVFNRLNR